jgi:hypothetical protein
METRKRPAGSAGRSRRTTANQSKASVPPESLPAGECRVCGVELPNGHVYCTRVHAIWDRREYLDDEPGWPA